MRPHRSRTPAPGKCRPLRIRHREFKRYGVSETMGASARSGHWIAPAPKPVALAGIGADAREVAPTAPSALTSGILDPLAAKDRADPCGHPSAFAWLVDLGQRMRLTSNSVGNTGNGATDIEPIAAPWQ